MNRLLLAVSIVLLTATSTPATSESPTTSKLHQVNVFTAGENGYTAFRIPVILRTDKGTLLAFCEARKKSFSDSGDIDLAMKRSNDDGRTWSSMQIVHEEGGDAPITIGNPCPMQDKTTGVIRLLFTRNNERLFMTSSKDDGDSWKAPEEITQAASTFDFSWKRLGTGPASGVQTPSGRLVAPIWLNDAPNGDYRAGALISDDQGATWKAGGLIPPLFEKCNENAIVSTKDGRLCMNSRNNPQTHRRVISWSEDGGVTWSKPELAETLIDPVCQGSMISTRALNPSDFFIFSNPASDKRERLTVRASVDAGRSWTSGRVLCEGPSAYSSLVELPNQEIGCLYECGDTKPYERITFAWTPHKWLLEND